MALNAPDVKIDLFLNDARNSYFLEDTTGLYSPDNLLGYNLPGGSTTTSITGLTITVNYTQLGANLVYDFTIAGGVITACSMNFAGSTPVSILSALPSTAWPFTSFNRFELTTDYRSGIVLPPLDDMVYQVSYEIFGTYLTEDFDYTAQAVDLMDVAAICCISDGLAALEINNLTGQELPLTASGYVIIAHSAAERGNIVQSNSYINRAHALCDSFCNCGC